MSGNTKKVGILTFSYSSNPGSVLQAYALQETISGFSGFDASIINYQKTGADKPKIGKNVFCGSIKNWTPKNIAKWTVRLVAYPMRMGRYLKFFDKFYKGFSETPVSREALPALAENYDKFVVGSDQVWNFGSINVDHTYFLDFVPDGEKKISYAASFGQKGVPDSEIKAVSPLLADFSHISVREEEGVKTVSELCKKTAEWVLDPSLIFPEEKWHQMAAAPKEKDYVFLYLREESASAEEFAIKLAKQYNLEVVKVFIHWKCNKKGKRTRALGPEEWLGYVKNAKYVVTNSFHGICFSINLKKEFYVDLLKNRADTNPRIAGVMAQFDLSDRRLDLVEDVSSLKSIDYEKVNTIKAQKTERSLNYLKNALGVEEND